MALDPAVNGLLAPVCRQELTELAGDLLLAGDAKLRAQLGEVGEDGVVGPGVVSLTRAQNAAEAVAIGVHGLVLPCGRLRERDELPNEGLNRRLRQQVVGSCLHLPLLIGVSVDGPIRERLEPLGAPRVQGVVGATLSLRVWQTVNLPHQADRLRRLQQRGELLLIAAGALGWQDEVIALIRKIAERCLLPHVLPRLAQGWDVVGPRGLHEVCVAGG